MVSTLQNALNDIVTQAGLQWQVRQELTPEDMVPAIEMVVAVPPDVGLAELVAVAPDTQFVALDIPDLPPAANLTTISTQGGRPDQQGFIAGEIAAMLSEDWRVGAISLSDTTEGRSARSGFVNGVVYFCGLCRPIHPPFYEYPTYVELPATATTAEWQEAANYMVDHAVRSVYVFPQAGDEAMLSILAQAGINIIGGIEPPASVASNWAVSLTSDPISFIQEQVAGLLDGSISGGQTLTVPIQFTNINPSIFTPGKQRLAQETLSDLQAGYIDTSVDLTTGENRP
jgi:basic membrane lipoprotein Med (substrate-binding protein (PBP1-ABC) superfamily)